MQGLHWPWHAGNHGSRISWAHASHADNKVSCPHSYSKCASCGGSMCTSIVFSAVGFVWLAPTRQPLESCLWLTHTGTLAIVIREPFLTPVKQISPRDPSLFHYFFPSQLSATAKQRWQARTEPYWIRLSRPDVGFWQCSVREQTWNERWSFLLPS